MNFVQLTGLRVVRTCGFISNKNYGALEIFWSDVFHEFALPLNMIEQEKKIKFEFQQSLVLSCK